MVSVYGGSLLRVAELAFPYNQPSVHQAFEAVGYIESQVKKLNALGYPFQLKTVDGEPLSANGDLMRKLQSGTTIRHSSDGSSFQTHFEFTVADEKGGVCARFFVNTGIHMPDQDEKTTLVVAQTGSGLFALETDLAQWGGKTDIKCFLGDVAEGQKAKLPEAKPVKENYAPGALRLAGCYIAERARAFKNG